MVYISVVYTQSVHVLLYFEKFIITHNIILYETEQQPTRIVLYGQHGSDSDSIKWYKFMRIIMDFDKTKIYDYNKIN